MKLPADTNRVHLHFGSYHMSYSLDTLNFGIVFGISIAVIVISVVVLLICVSHKRKPDKSPEAEDPTLAFETYRTQQLQDAEQDHESENMQNQRLESQNTSFPDPHRNNSLVLTSTEELVSNGFREAPALRTINLPFGDSVDQFEDTSHVYRLDPTHNVRRTVNLETTTDSDQTQVKALDTNGGGMAPGRRHEREEMRPPPIPPERPTNEVTYTQVNKPKRVEAISPPPLAERSGATYSKVNKPPRNETEPIYDRETAVSVERSPCVTHKSISSENEPIYEKETHVSDPIYEKETYEAGNTYGQIWDAVGPIYEKERPQNDGAASEPIYDKETAVLPDTEYSSANLNHPPFKGIDGPHPRSIKRKNRDEYACVEKPRSSDRGSESPRNYYNVGALPVSHGRVRKTSSALSDFEDCSQLRRPELHHNIEESRL